MTALKALEAVTRITIRAAAERHHGKFMMIKEIGVSFTHRNAVTFDHPKDMAKGVVLRRTDRGS